MSNVIQSKAAGVGWVGRRYKMKRKKNFFSKIHSPMKRYQLSKDLSFQAIKCH